MTEDEARTLLPAYADGLLAPKQTGEVEAALAASPRLQAELRKIREENALLTEALAPLRPTRSGRMRVAEAMQLAAQDMHRRAQEVAEMLPERGWRIFRLSFALVALGVAGLLGHFRPPPPFIEGETYVLYYVTLGLFAVGMIFLVVGNPLAHLEARIIGMMSQREVEPTRLEVLTLEVFGILSVVAAGIMYLLQ